MKSGDKQKLDLWLGWPILILLKIVTPFFGWLLRREHGLRLERELLFIKMQGGGSLVIALPALLGLRLKYPNQKLILLTTPSVSSFADTLGVFDEIVVVQDQGFLVLVSSSIRALWRVFRVDTVVDLEVYSILTGIFGLLTCARNRVGFYLDSARWRKNLFTHLIFFNRYSGSYFFYDEIARMFSAIPASQVACISHLRRVNDLPMGSDRRGEGFRIAIGHACSELGQERMLTPEQWKRVLTQYAPDGAEVVFLGSKCDSLLADEIIGGLNSLVHKRFVLKNECGRHSLTGSLRVLASVDLFLGIDSSLLHYSRLLGIESQSFWGPTDPETRLRDFPLTREKIHYVKAVCSPCIHVAEEPPCRGDNVCITEVIDQTGSARIRQSFLISPESRQRIDDGF